MEEIFHTKKNNKYNRALCRAVDDDGVGRWMFVVVGRVTVNGTQLSNIPRDSRKNSSKIPMHCIQINMHTVGTTLNGIKFTSKYLLETHESVCHEIPRIWLGICKNSCEL